MAGINLVGKLKVDRGTAPGPGADIAGLGARFGKAFSGSEATSADKVNLILMIVGISLVYIAHLGVERYTAQLAEEKRIEIAGIEKDIATERKKSVQLKEYQEEAVQHEQAIQMIKAKLAIVESAGKNRNYLVRALDYLVQEMPSNVWMTSLSLDLLTPTVSIKGNSLSMQHVAEYMQKLQPGVFFQSWTLSETRAVTTPGAVNAQGLGTGAPQLPPDYKLFDLGATVVLP